MIQLELSEQLKADGIQRVKEHSESWVNGAMGAIILLLRAQETITADDLRDSLGAWAPPPHPNAIGAAFNVAAKAGLIERDGFVKSTHPNNHGRFISVWRRRVA